jgi:chitin disaccharide deacetylase
MKLKSITTLLLVILYLNLVCQTAPARLIVRGDDLGASHAMNQAIMEAAKNGIQTSIEVMVPTSWFPEAVKLLKQNPHLDVGIHLTITSEWDNLKYRPLTYAKSITNSDGYFYPFIVPNKDYPGQSITENSYSLDEIEKEFRAQIEMAKKHILNISHISCHMGCTRFDPKVKEIADKLADEYGLNINPEEYNVKYVSYVGPKNTAKEKIKSLKQMILSLQAGETYLFVDHPGTNDPEMQAIHHIGYEGVAKDREGVTKAWTDPSVKKLIKQKGIQLISYADLKGKRKQLFNGIDHSGWYYDVPAMDKDPNVPNPFIIRNGYMVSLAHTGGHIITHDSFENYRLNIDYRFAGKPGNCGVLVHASTPRRLYSMFPQSIEVQMMHENAGDFWCIGENIEVDNMETRRGPKEKWGVDGDKNRRVINLTDGSEKPVGEWNHMQIDCIGKEIKVWVNGVLVNHGYNATATKGKIALQAEGSEVEFRSVTLTQY